MTNHLKNGKIMKKYDWLIVGAGLFGTTFAREMTNKGKNCLIVERDNFIGGNCASENIKGIEIHKFGAHIFHTNDDEVWKWINKYSEFNNFINSPIAEDNKFRIYNLPFNMNTFNQILGTSRPRDAEFVINAEIERSGIKDPKNLEEQAISMVGTTIFETLIKGYTEKQWGRKCSELPASIIKRLPLRFTYDNNFFNAKHQGIPLKGYSKMIETIIKGTSSEESIEFRLSVDFLKNRKELESIADKILFTGPIDAYFDYDLGHLEYRSLKFEIEEYNSTNYQGVAVKNYVSSKPLYTRSIEHKHFMFDTKSPVTFVSYELPDKWEPGKREYYPICDDKNLKLLDKYFNKCPDNVYFGGRLGKYEYNDMDVTIRKAIDLANGVI